LACCKRQEMQNESLERMCFETYLAHVDTLGIKS
jgi:hypothetical protein